MDVVSIESGRVYGCGSNGEGQLGIGLKHSLVWSPRHIAALTGNAWNRVTSVACGALHTLAVTIHGDVLGFGSNSMGLLSPDLSIDILDVPNTLERIAVRGGARAVYSGPFHSYAVLTSGSVVSCMRSLHLIALLFSVYIRAVHESVYFVQERSILLFIQSIVFLFLTRP